ncbi:MAG: sirohydrochlorin chelatase [Microcoleus sp.]
MRSTYLLVSHGSRDPRPQIALEHLAKLLAQNLADLNLADLNLADLNYGSVSSFPEVGTATLELGPAPLHEQICRFGEHTLSLGLTEIQILPVFLLAGVHVTADIPEQVAIAKQACASNLKIHLRPHLGVRETGLTNLVKTQMQEIDFLPNLRSPAWILLSHGSRQPGGNLIVETIASKVGAQAAYWSIKPSLAEKIDSFVCDGQQQIGIVPYFLFNGGITDAIARDIEQLKQQFPQTEIHLANPLNASVQLAKLIGELIHH